MCVMKRMEAGGEGGEKEGNKERGKKGGKERREGRRKSGACDYSPVGLDKRAEESSLKLDKRAEVIYFAF